MIGGKSLTEHKQEKHNWITNQHHGHHYLLENTSYDNIISDKTFTDGNLKNPNTVNLKSR